MVQKSNITVLALQLLMKYHYLRGRLIYNSTVVSQEVQEFAQLELRIIRADSHTTGFSKIFFHIRTNSVARGKKLLRTVGACVLLCVLMICYRFEDYFPFGTKGGSALFTAKAEILAYLKHVNIFFSPSLEETMTEDVQTLTYCCGLLDRPSRIDPAKETELRSIVEPTHFFLVHYRLSEVRKLKTQKTSTSPSSW